MAKKVYLIDPEIEILSLVELGANHTQVEDGKTVLLMKSADRIARENSAKGKNVTEKEKLEARRASLKTETALVESELSKLGEGETDNPNDAGGNKDKPDAEPQATTVGQEDDKTQGAGGTTETGSGKGTEPDERDAKITELEAKVTELEADRDTFAEAVSAANTAVDTTPGDEKAEEL